MRHLTVLSHFYISGGYKAPTFFVYGELVYILLIIAATRVLATLLQGFYKSTQSLYNSVTRIL